MRRLLFLVPALLSAACATVHETQHIGAHFNATLGAGGLSTTTSQDGISGKVSGSGGQFSVAAGGAVSPNLIIGGQFWLTSAQDPDVTIGGISGTASGSTSTLYGIGPMVKYYFMPIDLYVSGTPAITKLTTDDGNGHSGASEWGFGLHAAVGKEWYVSQRWGLGVAGYLDLSSNKDSGGAPIWTTAPTWSSVAGGVLFSASFN